MFEPVFRHFLAGIFKIFFRDIIAYTIQNKSYFMEIFVKPTILAVASKYKKLENTASEAVLAQPLKLE